MKFYYFRNGVTADWAGPRQLQRHQRGRGTPNYQLWRRRRSLVHAGLGIFFMLWSTSSLTLQSASGGSQEAGVRQAVAERTSAAALANSVLPETLSTHGGKQIYAKQMDASAFIQEHVKQGQQVTRPNTAECSCEVAGSCLPKGSCVAIACVLVVLSIVTVFLLAWLLQWLSAIPSEWVLAKRFRRRSLNFFSEKKSLGEQKPIEPFHSSSTTLTRREDQQPQHVLQSAGASPEEPLLEEHHDEAVDYSQGERGISEQYENRAASIPETENGRL